MTEDMGSFHDVRDILEAHPARLGHALCLVDAGLKDHPE